LDTSTLVSNTDYTIQKEAFRNTFKLIHLKGYDIIFGCDWIQQDNPIGLDFRQNSRQLTIMKNGKSNVTFTDFTQPLATPLSLLKN
jgi:hypothetical protein